MCFETSSQFNNIIEQNANDCLTTLWSISNNNQKNVGITQQNLNDIMHHELIWSVSIND